MLLPAMQAITQSCVGGGGEEDGDRWGRASCARIYVSSLEFPPLQGMEGKGLPFIHSCHGDPAGVTVYSAFGRAGRVEEIRERREGVTPSRAMPKQLHRVE